MDDLISRVTAIDALTDTNLKRNVDSVCDGDMKRARRAAQRVIAQLPAVDAIPMWWITEKFLDVLNKDKELSKAVWLVRKAWQKEQEGER